MALRYIAEVLEPGPPEGTSGHCADPTPAPGGEHGDDERRPGTARRGGLLRGNPPPAP